MKCQKCNSYRLHSQKLGTIDNFQWCLACGFQGYPLYQEMGDAAGSEKATKNEQKQAKFQL